MNKLTATAEDGTFVAQVDPETLQRVERDVLDADGRQKVMPASYYAGVDPVVRTLFCVRNGIYGLVTTELVEFIREHIAGRAAIEIGSGDGVLAAALCIPATDNRQQEWPSVRAHYERLGQAPVKYGPNIECMDGHEAVVHYRPQVIVASWLTHRYMPEEHALGGNMFAPSELVLHTCCETFILIGNSSVHANHRLLNYPHRHFKEPWLYSRTVRGKNFVGVWKGGMR